jgi:hypothetical protein
VEAEAAVEWMVPVDVDPTTLDVELDPLLRSLCFFSADSILAHHC